MAGLGKGVVSVLEPYIGDTAADTCVRATAIRLGKSFDTLSGEDLPALEDSVRKLLAPVAPATTIDGIIEDIRRVTP